MKLSVICAFVTTNSNSDCLQDHLITHFLVQSSVFCPNSAQQWLFSALFRFRHILIFDSFPLLTHWQMCRTEGIARSAASTWSGIVGYCGPRAVLWGIVASPAVLWGIVAPSMVSFAVRINCMHQWFTFAGFPLAMSSRNQTAPQKYIDSDSNLN